MIQSTILFCSDHLCYCSQFQYNIRIGKQHYYNFITINYILNILANEMDTISHGDELAYLFEPLNLDGTPLKESQMSSQQDEMVRNMFTKTITDFAKDGQIYLHGKIVPTFTSDSNNFIDISSNPEISNKFRYCEMALWAGLRERLMDASCQAQNALLSALGGPVAPLMNITEQLGTAEITNTLSKPLGTLTKPQSPFNILG